MDPRRLARLRLGDSGPLAGWVGEVTVTVCNQCVTFCGIADHLVKQVEFPDDQVEAGLSENNLKQPDSEDSESLVLAWSRGSSESEY
jgi:hypothetical protein